MVTPYHSHFRIITAIFWVSDSFSAQRGHYETIHQLEATKIKHQHKKGSYQKTETHCFLEYYYDCSRSPHLHRLFQGQVVGSAVNYYAI